MSRGGSYCANSYYHDATCCSVDTEESNVCGAQKKTYQRIYNGDRTTVKEWPWIAYLKMCKNYKCKICGATFINAEWVVTAAHCVGQFDPRVSSLTVGADEFDSNTGLPKSPLYPVRTYEIVKLEIHPDYNEKDGYPRNDIALIQVRDTSSSQQATFAPTPICLPDGEESAAGKNCWVAGYGKEEYSDRLPSFKLSEAHVPIASDEDCLNAYKGVDNRNGCYQNNRQKILFIDPIFNIIILNF